MPQFLTNEHSPATGLNIKLANLTKLFGAGSGHVQKPETTKRNDRDETTETKRPKRNDRNKQNYKYINEKVKKKDLDVCHVTIAA